MEFTDWRVPKIKTIHVEIGEVLMDMVLPKTKRTGNVINLYPLSKKKLKVGLETKLPKEWI